MAIGWARGVREARQDQGWWGKESGARHWRAAPHFIGIERVVRESSYLRVLL